MTPELAFEALLVSQDSAVLNIMHSVLTGFSMDVDVCVRPSQAIENFSRHSVDLVVVDCEQALAPQIIENVAASRLCPKPTILAVVSDANASGAAKRAGAHMIVTKPVKAESSAMVIKQVYSRMIREHRRYERLALMKVVSAKKESGSYFPVTISDVGEGGVGLLTKERLKIGEILECRLLLAGAEREIHISVQVLWTKPYGMAGAEFVNIDSSDLRVLYRWLWSKCTIKKMSH
ncbi:MAG TPA: PilZ domain-containing protein [Terriglobales bacterium]|nr:PilZ domain-containing protein [Terriglobales bacterium]